MALAYTKKDCGCYIDGAFGEDHRRAKLASLIRGLETSEMIDARGYSVLESLQGNPPDDLSDEDDALDILSQFTEDGLIWEFNAGDLILFNEEELE
jgi:hypothetical protein